MFDLEINTTIAEHGPMMMIVACLPGCGSECNATVLGVGVGCLYCLPACVCLRVIFDSCNCCRRRFVCARIKRVTY